VLLLPAGCGSESAALDATDTPPPAATGTAFEPAKAGRVIGRVTWTGPIPKATDFMYAAPRPDGKGFMFHTAENPNRPRIDANSRAVAGAVVFLRGVDPATGRPWDLPAVQVEMGQAQITVVQGERRGRVGFVRRGESVSVSSTEPTYHVLRGRGDAFFALTLPEPNRPVARTLTTAGRVELSSGTGQYWARADLFVADHPYFTLTDGEGRFSLDRVPAGNVELVVWMPGWEVARQERNPDSTIVTRQTYSPPVERALTLTVGPSAAPDVGITLP
jgi:hypothetical protein